MPSLEVMCIADILEKVHFFSLAMYISALCNPVGSSEAKCLIFFHCSSQKDIFLEGLQQGVRVL